MDYPDNPKLINSFLWLVADRWAEEVRDRFQAWGGIGRLLLALPSKAHMQESERPVGVMGGPQLMAIKEMLLPQGAAFCQPSRWAQEGNHPWSLYRGTQTCQFLDISLWDEAAKPAKHNQTSDLQNCDTINIILSH